MKLSFSSVHSLSSLLSSTAFIAIATTQPTPVWASSLLTLTPTQVSSDLLQPSQSSHPQDRTDRFLFERQKAAFTVAGDNPPKPEPPGGSR